MVLTNGNIIVVDPGYDAPGPIPDLGAVYLYNGATGVLINTLTGATAYDFVGSGGVTALKNGNYLVISPNWDNGAAAGAGAVTWGDGTAGASGVVSAANSLVGSTTGDLIGALGVKELSNGNYIVLSPYWDNGAAVDAGAVTWGSGATGNRGGVSAANSLVGSTAGDIVGDNSHCRFDCLIALSNGNYVVVSRSWHNGSAEGAGAVTWGNGTTGVSGVVSTANSLVGTTAWDLIGEYGVKELSNSSFVVVSPYWDNGAAANAGAVTWGNGSTGVSGVVSAANSLVGSTIGDYVGEDLVMALTNGSYVVMSPSWDNGPAVDAGAVTWGSGTTGISGEVSAANSLVGSTTGDQVGYGCSCSNEVTALSNGNYLVSSHYWDNGAAVDAGAVTWGSGTTGVSGMVSAANSLVGSKTGDGVYWTVVLANGNYVVASPQWDNGSVVDAGAVTWGSGAAGVIGEVSAANSLVSSRDGDNIGSGGVTALSSGGYVVLSPNWDSGAAVDAGAVTWGNGMTGARGMVSAANSLVGSTGGDRIGSYGVMALSNGSYVVVSTEWHNGSVPNAGAVTWGSSAAGVSGEVSAANSLVGSKDGDSVGSGGVTALSSDSYVVVSPYWDNGPAVDAGAVTWGGGAAGVSGVVSVANSLVGSTAGDGGGYGRAVALANGNYLVRSPNWDNGQVVNAGAVTWGDGAAGVSGVISATNSLVGTTAGDGAGSWVVALTNGSYVVVSPSWDNSLAADVGAVTWGNGAEGVNGAVSAVNSLVGSTAGDRVGSSGVTTLSNGGFVVRSLDWDNGPAADAGAVTLGNGIACPSGNVGGTINATNSVLGTAAGGGGTQNFSYDPINHQLVVGRPADNIVNLFVASDCTYQVFVPLILN